MTTSSVYPQYTSPDVDFLEVGAAYIQIRKVSGFAMEAKSGNKVLVNAHVEGTVIALAEFANFVDAKAFLDDLIANLS